MRHNLFHSNSVPYTTVKHYSHHFRKHCVTYQGGKYVMNFCPVCLLQKSHLQMAQQPSKNIVK